MEKVDGAPEVGRGYVGSLERNRSEYTTYTIEMELGMGHEILIYLAQM